MSLLEKRKGDFFHECESWSEEQRQAHTSLALRSLVTLAKEKSKYYQGTLSDYQIDFNAEYPLAKLPIITGADLRSLVPPVSRDILTSDTNHFNVFQSGGTTGVPKTSLFTHEEMELINECNARGFWGVGLNERDRVANLWAVGGLYMTFIHMHRVLSEYGCTSFPFSNATPVDFIHTVSKLFNINTFTGITSVVLNALREIYRKEPGCLKVEKIFFGGEHIYEADRKEMIDKYGVKMIAAPGYGTVDSWYLGYQCSKVPNGVFHAFDDMVYLEIVDEEKNQNCAKGEIGMLYASVFVRKLTPIIRFRVGDRARWKTEACVCGRTSPLFELLGRGDDVLRIGYDSIDYAAVQETALAVPGLSGRIQMEKKRIEGKDLLTIRIESGRPAEEFPALRAKFEEIFLGSRPSFREFVKKQTVLPLVTEILPEGKLPQNSRTGKLIRVIDAL